MNKRYAIVLVKEQWEVRYAGRRDPAMTVAVRQAVTMSAGKPTAMETQRKAVRFLVRFLNFLHRRGETRDAFLKEDVFSGRMRIEALLHRMGFQVAYDTNRLDGSCHVRGVNRSVSELPVWLAALSRLYAALARLGVRGRASPMKIDRWHSMPAIERFELAEAMVGERARHGVYRGSQYLAKGRAPSPLRIEDARELKTAMLAAGRKAGWPRAVYDLVTVIGIEGSRWSSTAPLTAADWGRSSGFSRTLWAPNKRSGDARVFQIVIRVADVLQIRASFDEDPDRPDMAELERLLAAKDWAALERIHLFPSKTGRPHTYHVLNNDYIRPAVEAAGLLIHGKNGSVRPTLHRLRSARVQESVDAIAVPGKPMDDIEAELAQLQQDVFIKSKKAFYRYVGERLEELGLVAKITRTDEREKRNKAAKDDGRRPQTRQERAATEAELWLDRIEREEMDLEELAA